MKRRQQDDIQYEDEFAEIVDADPSTIIHLDQDSTPEDWCEPESTQEEIEITPEEQDAESTKKAQPLRRKRGSRIGQFFTGGVLSQDEFTRRLPVFVFVVFLMLLYIANGFHIQHKHSVLSEISDDLKELKTEAVTISEVRMTATRQSKINPLLKEYGIPLIKDNTPTRIIKN